MIMMMTVIFLPWGKFVVTSLGHLLTLSPLLGLSAPQPGTNRKQAEYLVGRYITYSTYSEYLS